ncbi:MAG: DegT/DnrJ/EryC1/StrS family aminotransferase [Candidatus Fimivivens sp.]
MAKIKVVQPSMPPIEEYVAEIQSIWENRWLTHTGPKHQQLVHALSELLGTQEISLFSNGHQALEAAFSLFPVGSEVITTPFTFASTTLAIARCGLVPVFCDIEPAFYTMDPAKIEALITEKTVAIAPVHVYGYLCDWRRIGEIAAKHKLKVIYDAAHAFGVSEGGINAGSLGDISMFSFHATKVFHTIEGGCLAHHDAQLSRQFAAWRQFGMFDGEQSEMMGTNAKLTEFAAAMGLCNLRHLDAQIMQRKAVVERYRERLSGQNGLVIGGEQSGVTANYAYFPIRILPEQFGRDRNAVADALAQQEIFVRKYFYPLTADFPLCRNNFTVAPTPIAAQASRQILCLPLYADLTRIEVDQVCDAILKQSI